MKFRCSVFVFIGLLIISSIANAQSDFSGSWILNSTEHVSGPEYANALAKQVNIQQRDSLFVETISVGTEGKDIINAHTLSMSGTSVTYINPTSKRKIVRSLTWSEDKTKLTITSVYSMPENENKIDLTRIEIWQLSKDGMQLNIDKKSIEAKGDSWEVRGIFIKQ